MSGKALGWAKAQSAPSVVAKAVLVCLADYATSDHEAWPSVRVIAAEVQVSDRTVQRALRSLEEAGLLIGRDHERQDGGTTTRRYVLPLTPPTDCHRPPVTSVTPPVTMVSPATDPPSEPVGSDEPPVVAKATAEVPEEFLEAYRAYPHVKGRSSRAETLVQWRKLTKADRATFSGAVSAFAVHERSRPKRPDAAGPPAMERWIKRRLFEQWASSAVLTARFDGPAELRAAIAESQNEGFACSYVDSCHWQPDPPVLFARTGFAADELRKRCGPILGRFGVNVQQQIRT